MNENLGAAPKEPKKAMPLPPLGADDEAFERWWAAQFWLDAYTADDKATALAGWRGASLAHAPNDEKLRLLRRVCADAESNGWQHMATATVRAVLSA